MTTNWLTSEHQRYFVLYKKFWCKIVIKVVNLIKLWMMTAYLELDSP